MVPISVTALNRYVKTLLDGNELLSDLTISAELDSFHPHRKTGHCYFTLKDADSSIKAVMFSRDAARLSFVPEDGMQLLVRAKATIYQKDGTFQLYVSHMFLDGEGALNAAFMQMKQRLEKRGLFAIEHKKPLPKSPTCIGLVTSKDGAALQDILAVAKRRALKNITFVLYDVPVQGAAAAKPIANGIKKLDAVGCIDVILISRGGGSAQDLFVFNSEEIAEAVYNAKKPIVSAIGHEVDTVISDLVADVRAATPTAASEIILPDPSQMMYRYDRARSEVSLNRIRSEYNKIEKNLAEVKDDLTDTMKQRVKNERQHLNLLIHRLTAYDPKKILEKGYAVVRDEEKNISTDIPKTGDNIILETSKSIIGCKVSSVEIKHE